MRLMLIGLLILAGLKTLAGEKTILLVDYGDVLYCSGTQRLLHPAVRYSVNPVIRSEKPWEGDIGWCSVYRNPETGIYQLWYQAYTGAKAQKKSDRCVVCYAESKDGISFHKPELKLHSWNGIEKTNIVLVGNGGYSDRYGCSVIVDPFDKDPQRRYKMTCYDFAVDNGREYPGLNVAFSPDGIHWTRYPKAPLSRTAYGNHGAPVPLADEKDRPWDIPLTMSDALDVFYDTPRSVFAIYGKMWIDGPDGGMFWKHAMGRIESKDFIHWSKPQFILAPDDLDASSVEFHTSPVFYYNNRYFSLNQILDRAQGGGVVDVELMTSRDGFNWERPFRKSFFLPRGAPGQFDSGSVFTNSTPVILEDEIRFYYGAYSGGATGPEVSGMSSGIGLASIPKDRFAGIRPVSKSDQPTLKKPLENTGQVTLKPVELTHCRKITLNADASSGSIRVELLDRDGKRVRRFTAQDCAPIEGDSLKHQVSWRSAALQDLPPGKYMFRIHLYNAILYAVYFQF